MNSDSAKRQANVDWPDRQVGFVALYLNLVDSLTTGISICADSRILSVVGLGSQLSHHQVKVSRLWTKRLYVSLVMPMWHVLCCHLLHPSHWTASCRGLTT